MRPLLMHLMARAMIEERLAEAERRRRAKRYS
jgi:hypothetical protein